MRVLLVTTWDQPCGIAEHSWYLTQAVEAADPGITIEPSTFALDPYWLLDRLPQPIDLVHLNYHAALHSRWTPAMIYSLKTHTKVVVTYHDTGVPNSDHCKAICAAADAAVVHEPFDDLPVGHVHYWRMGVPDWQRPAVFDTSWCGYRPILGSIGFPFPWKHYDLLAKITGEIGWALLLVAPTATDANKDAWYRLNSHLLVRDDFVPRAEAISLLAGCDATAFPYVCHNTGQSGAILQGIAARKPVHAFATCRQFRALFADPLGRTAITWAETAEDLAFNLSHFTPITGRPSAPIVALAEQDSWTRLGAKYAALYREVVR